MSLTAEDARTQAETNEEEIISGIKDATIILIDSCIEDAVAEGYYSTSYVIENLRAMSVIIDYYQDLGYTINALENGEIQIKW